MSAERLFCPECGASNEGDAAFCESCGNRLDQVQETAPAAESEELPPRRWVSPKVIAVVALLIFAGGAWALRAPIGSFVGSKGEEVKTADSVQLVPAQGEPQLQDNPGVGNADFVITPEMLNQAQGQAQRDMVQRPAPQIANAPPRTAERSNSSSRTSTSSPMPLPAEPPDFPEFKEPAEPPRASPTGTGSGSVGSTAPAAAAPAPGRIAAGAVLSLKSASQVCTDKTAQGARFTAIVQQDVPGFNGATIPQGTSVTFVVDRLKRSQNSNEKSEFSVAPESIELSGDRYPIVATVDAVTIKQKSRSMLGALAGAAAAAAAAKAAGGDTKQTIAGGVAGGAAGAIIGNQIRGGDGCIEKNAAIRITLGSDLTLNSR